MADLSPSERLLDIVTGEKSGARRTRLEGGGSLVVGAGGRLGGLVESGLLGVRSGLLLDLVAETLASAHVSGAQ